MFEFDAFIIIILFLMPFIGSLISLIVAIKKEKEVDKALYLSLPFMLYFISIVVYWVIAIVIAKVIPDGIFDGIYVGILVYITYLLIPISLLFSPIVMIISFWFAYKNKKSRIWWIISGVISLLSLFFYLDPFVRPFIVIWFIGKKIKGKLKEWLWAF